MAAMRPLPTGTVTFLFSDIEGSTRLVGELGAAGYTAVLERHQALLRAAFVAEGGTEVKTEGDSFFVVFPSAIGAVAAAVAAQRALATEGWPPEVGQVRVRIGLHTGEGTLGADDYVGLDVHRAARIAAAAHGGQVLVSATTRGLIGDAFPEGVSLRELGAFRLKDLGRPEPLGQLCIDGLRTDFPPPRTLDTPTNLPPQLTSFIGRSREIAELEARLRDPANRLVTLTGPGGTGKTRLSLAVAAELLADFPDGVFFVELAPIADPDLVIGTIAGALSLKEEAGRPIDSILRDHLRDRQVLLVLDNFEQVVAAAPRVSELLVAAARLTLLISSREVLHVRAEREYPVPPLPYPAAAIPGRTLDVGAVSQYDAVALFIARAAAVRPDFEVTAANAPAIAEICVRLDGLPLAIELAAARIRLFEPEAILSRLQKSLGFLTGGGRDLPARQQTLRGAIAWSYDLLSPEEQRLFRRLAVFIGGWSLAAAEAVCDAAPDLGIDVLDGLVGLVDKSLVRREDTDDGEPRFGNLATIREFALEQLEASDEAAVARERHARFFLDLAEQVGPRLTGADGMRWLDALVHEQQNVRAALGWSLSIGQVEVGLRILGSIWRFWQQHSALREGRRWADELLAHPAAGAPSVARADALDGAGGIAYWQGDFEAAGRFYAEGLSIAEAVDDRALLARAHYDAGFIDIVRGDREALGRHFEASLELYRGLPDPDGVTKARQGLVLGRLLEEDFAGARALEEENARYFRTSSSRINLGDSLTLLAGLCTRAGDLAAARGFALEALDLMEETNILVGVLGILQVIAIVEAAVGRPDRAATLAGAVESYRSEAETMMAPVQILRLDDPAEAARAALGEVAFAEASERGRGFSRPEAIAFARAGLAAPG
jgi:predicted ATPase/class 3 adenylate cyclase